MLVCIPFIKKRYLLYVLFILWFNADSPRILNGMNTKDEYRITNNGNVINLWHVSYRYDTNEVPAFISKFYQKMDRYVNLTSNYKLKWKMENNGILDGWPLNYTN